jgi:hypothetical protein
MLGMVRPIRKLGTTTGLLTVPVEPPRTTDHLYFLQARE